MGSYSEEDRRFREMFGVGPMVALTAWSMLTTLGLQPFGGTLIHYLWALCFLKVYAKQGPMCVLCGGVDHKTLKKWVDAFVMALADLEPHVVRFGIVFLYYQLSHSNLTQHTDNLEQPIQRGQRK